MLVDDRYLSTVHIVLDQSGFHRLVESGAEGSLEIAEFDEGDFDILVAEPVGVAQVE
jgi:hypothetical protein